MSVAKAVTMHALRTLRLWLSAARLRCVICRVKRLGRSEQNSSICSLIIYNQTIAACKCLRQVRQAKNLPETERLRSSCETERAFVIPATPPRSTPGSFRGETHSPCVAACSVRWRGQPSVACVACSVVQPAVCDGMGGVDCPQLALVA